MLRCPATQEHEFELRFVAVSAENLDASAPQKLVAAQQFANPVAVQRREFEEAFRQTILANCMQVALPALWPLAQATVAIFPGLRARFSSRAAPVRPKRMERRSDNRDVESLARLDAQDLQPRSRCGRFTAAAVHSIFHGPVLLRLAVCQTEPSACRDGNDICLERSLLTVNKHYSRSNRFCAVLPQPHVPCCGTEGPRRALQRPEIPRVFVPLGQRRWRRIDSGRPRGR